MPLAQAAAFAQCGGRVSGGQRPLCQPSCPAHPNSSARPCSSSPETQAQGGPHKHYSSDKHSTDKREHRTHSRRNGNGHTGARVLCRTSASSRGSWYRNPHLGCVDSASPAARLRASVLSGPSRHPHVAGTATRPPTPPPAQHCSLKETGAAERRCAVLRC